MTQSDRARDLGAATWTGMQRTLTTLIVGVVALVMVTSLMAPAMAAPTGTAPAAVSQPDSDGALASVGTAEASGTGTSDTEPAASSFDGHAASTDPTSVTLVTGHTVELRETPDGETTVLTNEDEDVLHQVDTPQGTYVFPDDVDLDVYDRELFNVDFLLEQNLSDAETDEIPVIIDGREVRSVGPGAEPAMAALDGFQRSKTLDSIGATAGTVDKAAAADTLERVFETHDVDRIHLDRKVEVDLDTSAAAVDAAHARDQHDVTGDGATVAVLDTGVDATHPDLEHAVVDQTDFTGDGVGDVHGHGTHVAGTVAGSGAASNGSYVGIAPDADLVDVKVLDDQGTGNISDIVAGIEYAHDQDVDVISMSLGGPGSPDSPMNQALNDAIDDGIVAVVAAGNSGDDYETLDDPGLNERAITVGAYDHAAERMATFSSRGPTSEQRYHGVDLVAPGVSITAAAAGTDGETETMSGTSMATPHVSGATALLLERDGALDTDAARERLLSTADPLDGYDAYTQGAGYLNVSRALAPSLVIDDPTHNFGTLDADGTVSTVLTLENPTDEARTLTAETELTTLDGDRYDKHLHLNRSEIEVGPGEAVPVELTANASVPSGDYSGAVHLSDDVGTEYRAVVAFARGSADVTVSGSVTHADGAPAAHDRVSISGRDLSTSVYTDADGAFATDLPANDRYSLGYYSADDEAFAPVRDGSPDIAHLDRIEVADEDVTLDGYSLPEANVLDVKVVDEAGDPVEGADVRIVAYNENRTSGWGTGFGPSTNADGYLDFESVEGTGMEVAGELTVQVEPPEADRFANETYEEEITVENDETVDFELEESDDVRVTGQLLDATGDPVVHDQVKFGGDDGDLAVDYTAADGTFDVAVPANSSYLAGYFRTDETGAFAPVADGSPDIRTLPTVETAESDVALGELELEAASHLDVRVVDANGAPVEDARVRVYDQHPEAHSSWGTGPGPTTNADGYLDFESFEGTGIEVVDNVTVRVDGPEGDDRFANQTIWESVSVTGDESVELTLEESVEESVTVSGEVVRADGEPAANDELLLDGTTVQTTTADDGAFAADVEANRTHSMGYYHQVDGQFHPVRDGAPDVHSFEHVPVGDEDVDLGTVSLPEAHVLDVVVVDEGGDPVPDAEVSVTSYNDDRTSGYGTGPATTNETGQFIYPGADEPGIEVAGEVTVTVDPPEDDRFENTTHEQELTITENETVEMPLTEAVDPAVFDVAIDGTNAPVTEGETLTVNTTVANVGDEADTQTVELRDENQTLRDETTVALQGGETTSVPLEWPTEAGDAGNHTLTVTSENDTASTAVAIEAVPDPADFEVTDLEPGDVTAPQGEAITVSANVTNVGDEPGEQPIDLRLAGDERDTETLELAAGDTEPVTFANVSTGGLAAGDYEYGMSSENDSETATLSIVESPWFAVTDLDAPAEATAGAALNVSAAVENRGEAGTQRLELRLGENLSTADTYTVLENETVSLDAGATGTVNFETTLPESVDEERLDVGIASNETLANTTLAVETDDGGAPPAPPMPAPSAPEPEAASFALGAVDLPDEVTPGSHHPVAVTVENVGDESGTAEVTLSLAGDRTTTTVAVDPGETKSVTLDAAVPAAAGEYDVTIETADDGLTTTLVVESADDADADEDEETDERDASDGTDAGSDGMTADERDDVTTDDGVPGFGVVAALAAVALFAATRRARSR